MSARTPFEFWYASVGRSHKRRSHRIPSRGIHTAIAFVRPLCLPKEGQDDAGTRLETRAIRFQMSSTHSRFHQNAPWRVFVDQVRTSMRVEPRFWASSVRPAKQQVAKLPTFIKKITSSLSFERIRRQFLSSRLHPRLRFELR